ncbi:MAG: hypothetical protein U0704_05845 [Candidatus Eisenbacteria bacterium]
MRDSARRMCARVRQQAARGGVGAAERGGEAGFERRQRARGFAAAQRLDALDQSERGHRQLSIVGSR